MGGLARDNGAPPLPKETSRGAKIALQARQVATKDNQKNYRAAAREKRNESNWHAS